MALTVLTWALSFIERFLSNIAHNTQVVSAIFLAGFTALALAVIGNIIHIGIIKIGLEVVDGKKPNVEELLTHTKLFWRFIGVSIISSLLFAAGIILPIALGFLLWHGFVHFKFAIPLAFVLILPLVYFVLTYCFAPVILVDKEAKVFESFKKSAHISKSNKLSLLGFGVVIGLINLLAALLCGIGLLVTVPVSFLAFLQLYRKLA
jgi:hypothetical protein